MSYTDAEHATREMTKDPATWPMIEILPLKHRTEHDETGWPLLGFMLRDNLLTVRIGCIHMITDAKSVESMPVRNYENHDQLIAEWRVD